MTPPNKAGATPRIAEPEPRAMPQKPIAHAPEERMTESFSDYIQSSKRAVSWLLSTRFLATTNPRPQVPINIPNPPNP